MDPTQRINALRQYMDFYRNSGADARMRSIERGHTGFNPTPYDSDAAALEWAQRQVGQEDMDAPDFFAGSQAPQFTAPQGPAKMPAAMPLPQVDQSQSNNFLRDLLTRYRR